MTVEELALDLRRYTPAILVGQAASAFRKLYSGPIQVVHTTEEVREVVDRYTGVRCLDHAIILDDLAFVSARSTSLLLKFVEESTFPIVLLYSFDAVSPVLLSRVRTVLKSIGPVSSEFGSVRAGMEALRELPRDSHSSDKLKVYIKHAPILYFLEHKISGATNKEKILSLVE